MRTSFFLKCFICIYFKKYRQQKLLIQIVVAELNQEQLTIDKKDDGNTVNIKQDPNNGNCSFVSTIHRNWIFQSNPKN